MSPTLSHSQTILHEWDRVVHLLTSDGTVTHDGIVLDGSSLDVASIVAVARHSVPVTADPLKLERLIESSQALQKSLSEGQVIYGVNTGFGGSANTRTKKVEELQSTLMHTLRYGILPLNGSIQSDATKGADPLAAKLQSSLLNEDPNTSSVMPEAWSRAALLIRANSLIRGHSAVRPQIVERMMDMIRYGISPKIPMFGSISASGDLSPLSYIGAAIQGKQNLAVWPIRSKSSTHQNISAAEAFNILGLDPVKLAAKESLAIVNGTAVSCAASVLALHDGHGLAVLSQILTAMTVEALCGSIESFDPFFAEVRPHPGQVESAHNIFSFLKGSRLLASTEKLSETGTLRQDRYSVRTAPQWIGPVLEDFLLAHSQISIEANSTTDNPLVNKYGQALSGGNFQAKSLTSAMEKVRQGVQSLGRMHFAQCTELINPATNTGLPPNLVADDPSESFIFKGVDISIAAFQSELGFLANPVGSHVQTAEMGNQALNSLALISARYTHTALDILSRLTASHLLAVCQALDLRAMQATYLDMVRGQVEDLTREHLIPHMHKTLGDRLTSDIWSQLKKSLDSTTTMDTSDRFSTVTKSLLPIVLEGAYESSDNRLLSEIGIWKNRLTTQLEDCWIRNRNAYLAHGDATAYLGPASRRMYSFVRHDLHVPLLHAQMLQTSSEEANDPFDKHDDVPTVGTFVGVIYRAIRSGILYIPAMECLQEANQQLTNGNGNENGHGH